MEFRIKDCELQADDSGLLKVGGYINVTERESEMLYNKRNGKWFKETMKSGVFQKAIDIAREIPLLFEHNWDKKLASVKDGSLTLVEDNIGLRFDAVIEDKSVYEQVKAGIINSCSFGFRALEESIESVNNKFEKRIVSAIELLEVSLVKNPAYVGSLCESRSYEEELQEEKKCAPEEIREDSTEEETKEEETKIEANETSEDDDDEKEEAEDEVEDEKEESDEEADERFIEAQEVMTTPEVAENIEIEADEENKAYLNKIVSELIDAKIEEIKLAEAKEEVITEELEFVKEIHEEVESNLQEETMMQNAEVIRLRLELLKLTKVKEGI